MWMNVTPLTPLAAWTAACAPTTRAPITALALTATADYIVITVGKFITKFNIKISFKDYTAGTALIAYLFSNIISFLLFLLFCCILVAWDCLSNHWPYCLYCPVNDVLTCTDLDWCRGEPCAHGQCINNQSAQSYMCQCAAGYTGRDCDQGKIHQLSRVRCTVWYRDRPTRVRYTDWPR